MTQPITGEQQSADKAKEAIPLSEAARIVREAISAKENHLKQLTGSKENHPIMLEGQTSAGYDVQMMVDPAKIAYIMLDYQYPHCVVLEEEPPLEMWCEIAMLVGLKEVRSVDIQL